MKHQKKKRELGRVRKQRRALLKTLLGSLVLKEKIQTTEAKAKEIKGLMDKLINKAKKYKKGPEGVAVVRDLNNSIPKVAVKKIISEDFLGKTKSRRSGYSRIIKLERRKSDGARLAIIEFVD